MLCVMDEYVQTLLPYVILISSFSLRLTSEHAIFLREILLYNPPLSGQKMVTRSARRRLG